MSGTQITAKQLSDVLTIMESATGKPYSEQIPERFGPNVFDCSGLVWYAFNKAGIPMPGGPSDDPAAIVDPELQWLASQPGAKAIFSAAMFSVLSGPTLALREHLSCYLTGNCRSVISKLRPRGISAWLYPTVNTCRPTVLVSATFPSIPSSSLSPLGPSLVTMVAGVRRLVRLVAGLVSIGRLR
jgi:hypothetical protein